MFRKLVMRLLSLGLKSWKECEKSEAEPLCLVIMRRKGKRRFSNWDNGEGMVRRKIRRRMGFAWKEKKVSSFLNMLNSRVFLRHRSWKVHEALGKFSKSFPYFSKTSIAGLKRWERWWDQGVITGRRTSFQNGRNGVQKSAKVKRSRWNPSCDSLSQEFSVHNLDFIGVIDSGRKGPAM